MKNLVLAALFVTGLFTSGITMAQDEAAPAAPELTKEEKAAKKKEISEQIREENKSIGQIAKKLNVNADPEIKEIQKQISELAKKQRELIKSKVSADPVGAAAYKKIDELNEQLKELNKKAPKAPKAKKGKKATE